MDDEGWTKTKRGKVVYPRPNRPPFNANSIGRILGHHLGIQRWREDDTVFQQFVKFGVNQGFISPFSSVYELSKRGEPMPDPPWWPYVIGLMYRIGHAMGISQEALEMADQIGLILKGLVAPEVHNYYMNAHFTEVFTRAVDSEETTGGWDLWLQAREGMPTPK